MRNIANISEPEELLFFESAAVIKRLKELELQPITVYLYHAWSIIL